MTRLRPYLLKAFYEWIVDNQLSPYLIVNANFPGTKVPRQYVKDDGKIILDISPSAVQNLQMKKDAIEFYAAFGNIPMMIRIPIMALEAIYAQENGRGIPFALFEENEDDDPPSDKATPPSSKNGNPHLRIVK